MRPVLKSLFAAGAVTLAVQTCTVGVIAPRLGRSVAASPAVTGHPHFVKPGHSVVDFQNEDGAVMISTHNEDTIEIRIAFRIYTMEAGKQAAADAEAYAQSLISVAEDGDTLHVVTEPSERPDGMEVFADYEIVVPDRTDLKLHNTNGNVSIASGCSAIDVRGRNADVSVMGAEGPVVVRTTNGRISVVDAEAGADLATVNGNVFAHVRGGSLRADTTNGQIVARLLDKDVDNCDLTTRNGGISVVLSEGSSAQLEARTARGAVTHSQVDVDVSSGIDRRRHLRGLIGEGRTALTMDSLNGNIVIMRSVP